MASWLAPRHRAQAREDLAKEARKEAQEARAAELAKKKQEAKQLEMVRQHHPLRDLRTLGCYLHHGVSNVENSVYDPIQQDKARRAGPAALRKYEEKQQKIETKRAMRSRTLKA